MEEFQALACWDMRQEPLIHPQNHPQICPQICFPSRPEFLELSYASLRLGWAIRKGVVCTTQSTCFFQPLFQIFGLILATELKSTRLRVAVKFLRRSRSLLSLYILWERRNRSNVANRKSFKRTGLHLTSATCYDACHSIQSIFLISQVSLRNSRWADTWLRVDGRVQSQKLMIAWFFVRIRSPWSSVITHFLSPHSTSAMEVHHIICKNKFSR